MNACGVPISMPGALPPHYLIQTVQYSNERLFSLFRFYVDEEGKAQRAVVICCEARAEVGLLTKPLPSSLHRSLEDPDSGFIF